jgi:sortase A
MKKSLFERGKVLAKYVAVSFFFTAMLILLFSISAEDKSVYLTNLVNSVASGTPEENTNEISMENKLLSDYPEYGTKYAKIIIEEIDMKLPVYYGDDADLLHKGVGMFAGSYFPGEGGTTIIAGHNNKGIFYRLPELKTGSIITIDTIYGTFKYSVREQKVVNETDEKEFEIKEDQEELILYTCYPIGRSVVGRKTQRYMIKADRVME